MRSCLDGHRTGNGGQPIRAWRAALGTLPGGGVSERPKEHASKACEVKASEGSNPSATANVTRADAGLRLRAQAGVSGIVPLLVLFHAQGGSSELDPGDVGGRSPVREA